MNKRCCAGSCFNSQQINKNVAYFGFPKYEEFAVKWAMAAGRSDLLDKKLSSITKYFLCSEHFENECFLDPPHNTRLKKTLNPVNIPVPSIFKGNITKYMPKPKPSTSTGYAEDDDDADDVEDDKKMNTLCRIREGLTLESLSVFHDHYNYTDITNCASSFLNNVPDIPPNIGVSVDLSAEGIFPDDVLHSVDVNTLHICRLCAEKYASSENIVEISSDVYDRLNVLVSNTMHNSNRLPMIACTSCLDRLNTCLSTLEFFKKAQSKLRRTYPAN